MEDAVVEQIQDGLFMTVMAFKLAFVMSLDIRNFGNWGVEDRKLYFASLTIVCGFLMFVTCVIDAALEKDRVRKDKCIRWHQRRLHRKVVYS